MPLSKEDIYKLNRATGYWQCNDCEHIEDSKYGLDVPKSETIDHKHCTACNSTNVEWVDHLRDANER